jgi:hypothetical protein
LIVFNSPNTSLNTAHQNMSETLVCEHPAASGIRTFCDCRGTCLLQPAMNTPAMTYDGDSRTGKPGATMLLGMRPRESATQPTPDSSLWVCSLLAVYALWCVDYGAIAPGIRKNLDGLNRYPGGRANTNFPTLSNDPTLRDPSN